MALNFNVDKRAGRKINKDWVRECGAKALKMRAEYEAKGNMDRFPDMFKMHNMGENPERPFQSILGTFKTFSAMCSAGAKYGNMKRKERMLERVATQPGQTRITDFLE